MKLIILLKSSAKEKVLLILKKVAKKKVDKVLQ